MKDHPVILFDGVCNLCNGTVQFLIRNDRQGILRFAPLQSQAGLRLQQQYGLSQASLSSVILIDEGRVYLRSSAALRLTRYLPWYWKTLRAFYLIPTPLRDAAYNLIARNRYRWFGKRESCMIPGEDVRERFFDN